MRWDRARSPTSFPQGKLTCTPTNRITSTVLPSKGAGSALPRVQPVGTGPVLPSASANEGQVQQSEALSSQPSVVAGATDIKIDLGCVRVIDPNMVLSSSTELDFTMTPLFTVFTSSNLPLSTEHDSFCLPLTYPQYICSQQWHFEAPDRSVVSSHPRQVAPGRLVAVFHSPNHHLGHF